MLRLRREPKKQNLFFPPITSLKALLHLFAFYHRCECELDVIRPWLISISSQTTCNNIALILPHSWEMSCFMTYLRPRQCLFGLTTSFPMNNISLPLWTSLSRGISTRIAQNKHTCLVRIQGLLHKWSFKTLFSRSIFCLPICRLVHTCTTNLFCLHLTFTNHTELCFL